MQYNQRTPVADRPRTWAMHGFTIQIKPLKEAPGTLTGRRGAGLWRLFPRAQGAGIQRFRALLPALLLLADLTARAAPADTGIDMQEVRPGVWVHQGRHLPMDHPQGDDIANIGFVVGQQCIAVIDSGGSVAMGHALLQAIRQVSDKPICHVINTHIHFDHLLGNAAFADGKTRFVGHARLAPAVEHNRRFFHEQFPQWLANLPENEAVIGPDLTVEDQLRLDLGGRSLLLLALPEAHTDSDLVVIDEHTATLWAGDLIVRQRLPVLTGSLRGWLQVMDTLRALQPQPAVIIPGHGAVAHSMDEALAAQQRYLHQLLTATRQAIRAGQFVNELVEHTSADNPDQWLLFSEQHPANVSRAWRELEWE